MTQFLKLRGLPFSATEIDVLQFLEGLPIWEESAINLTYNEDGRLSGEALVRLTAEVKLTDLSPYNGRYMGNRFIEVFPSSQREYALVEGRKPAAESTIIRMRGLPFDVSKEDVYVFFRGLTLARDGVGIIVGPDGYPTGEAYVQFNSKEDSIMALQRHNQSIRSRYIELYRSSMMDCTKTMERQYQINREELLKQFAPPPNLMHQQLDFNYDAGNFYAPVSNIGPMKRGNKSSGQRKSSGPYSGKSRKSMNDKLIYMRGLPYTATEQDIRDFFVPIMVKSASILRGNDGKVNGEAEAEFETEEDARTAMSKDRCKMSWRYIELFLGGKK